MIIASGVEDKNLAAGDTQPAAIALEDALLKDAFRYAYPWDKNE